MKFNKMYFIFYKLGKCVSKIQGTAFIIFVLLFNFNTLFAKIFYIDPIKGKNTNTGTYSSPWHTLQEVIENKLIESNEWSENPPTSISYFVKKNPGAPVKSGDTLMLLNGYHGKIELTGYFNSSYITITAKKDHIPKISSLYILGGSFWKVSGLSISSEFTNSYSEKSLVRIESHNWHGDASNCIIENCSIYSIYESSRWTMDQWNSLSQNGILVSGEKCTIQNNLFKNVNFGIFIIGNNNLIKGNTIENFAGDGLTGCANNLVFEYNVVKNCYKVNANHDDGFQSYVIGDAEPWKNVVLRGNTIINNVKEDQPFLGSLQGIGCFDGFYIDWIVENNVVITNNVHGITFMGAKNSRFINNTVICTDKNIIVPTRINITSHKDGRPSENCVIRNNLTTGIKYSSGILQDHNIIINYNDYETYFIDYKIFNLNLRPNSLAIDFGSLEMSPSFDILKNIRPYGHGIDAGAFEYIGDSLISNDSIEESYKNLFYAYPNPFTTYTTVFFRIKSASNVKFELMNIDGTMFTTLLSSFLTSGEYTYYLQPEKYNLKKGIYICRIIVGDSIIKTKLLYL